MPPSQQYNYLYNQTITELKFINIATLPTFIKHKEIAAVNAVKSYSHLSSWQRAKKAGLSLPTSFYVLHILNSAIHFPKLLFARCCLSGNLFKVSIPKQYIEFKTTSGNLRIYVNSKLKTLFVYNCKNIFLHFSEKTNLLFRMDNKLRFSEEKMR